MRPPKGVVVPAADLRIHASRQPRSTEKGRSSAPRCYHLGCAHANVSYVGAFASAATWETGRHHRPFQTRRYAVGLQTGVCALPTLPEPEYEPS